MTTLLEHRFNFTPDDLAANQNGHCTDRQIDELSAYRRAYLKRDGRVLIALTILLTLIYLASIINALFYDGSVIALCAFTFYYPFFIGGSLRTWHHLQFHWSAPLRDRHTERVTDVQRSHFALQKRFSAKGFQDYYQFERDDWRFRLTPDQYGALDDEKLYRVYYFPVKDDDGNYPILAIE